MTLSTKGRIQADKFVVLPSRRSSAKNLTVADCLTDAKVGSYPEEISETIIVHTDEPPTVEIDSSVPAAYIRFSKEKVASTQPIEADDMIINVDLDESGQVVGFLRDRGLLKLPWWWLVLIYQNCDCDFWCGTDTEPTLFIFVSSISRDKHKTGYLFDAYVDKATVSKCLCVCFHFLIRWTPVTTAPGNMSMTVRRASGADSACTVMSRPLPLIE